MKYEKNISSKITNYWERIDRRKILNKGWSYLFNTRCNLFFSKMFHLTNVWYVGTQEFFNLFVLEFVMYIICPPKNCSRKMNIFILNALKARFSCISDVSEVVKAIFVYQHIKHWLNETFWEKQLASRVKKITSTLI